MPPSLSASETLAAPLAKPATPEMHDKHAALVSLGRHLGLFTDHVKVDAVYGISEEPMSAEEWKKQYVKEG